MFTGKRLAVYIPVIAMLLCLVSLSVQGATFNLAPTADAYVSGGSATTNYGTNANLLVKGAATASYIRESYLKFDLAGVTGTITSATLKLYCTSIEGTPASVDAYTCTTDSWTETGITYSNKPAKGTLITSVNIPSAAAWYSFDVTDFVNGQYAGDKIVTIILAQGSTVKKNVYFNSKEAASDKPVLEVITGTASTPTPTPTLTPTPTATPTPTPSSSPGVNLALNKPVTFSSQQAGNEASHAVDGDLATRWSADTYPEWIQVDLGATYTVNRTEVCPYLDRAYQFKVEVSTNGTSYTQVVDRLSNTTGGAVISDTFAAASARYVKLTVTGASGYTGTWTSINEFRVFNSGSLPSPTPTPTSTPTPTPSYTPTPPASTPTPTPTPTSTPIGGEGYMIITEAELMALPTSGPEYDFMKGIADSTFPGVNLADQDNRNAAYTLAAALIYARTGIVSYKTKVLAQLDVIANKTPADVANDPLNKTNHVLALGRQLAGYVIAADLVGYQNSGFVTFLRDIRSYPIGTHGRWQTLESCAKNTCANWGAWALSSITACNIYLGDTAELSKCNDLMSAILLGDRAAYQRATTPVPSNAPPECVFGEYFQKTAAWDATYAHDPDNWWAVNPSTSGQKSGCIVDDASRSAYPYPQFDDTAVQYCWETMGGWMLTARLLYHAGYTDIYSRSNNGLLRCAQFMHDVAGGYPPTAQGMDVPIIQVNKAYGVNLGPLFPDGNGGLGRQFAFADWLSPR